MKGYFEFIVFITLCRLIFCQHFARGPLLRVTTATKHDVEVLKSVISAHQMTLDIWRSPEYPGDSADMLLLPEARKDVMSRLRASGLSNHILHKDVAELVDAHLAKNQAAGSSLDQDGHYNYRGYLPYEEVLSWLDQQVESCNVCQKFIVGKTYEGRDMVAMKISTGEGRKGFWMDGGIHAREWISPATVMYMAEQLISRRSTDDDVRKLLNTYDWYILPVMNVDGYVYTWQNSTTRLWRKSRRPVNETCIGTDVNRNFAFYWDTIGTSDDACSDIYPGPAPFSEPEASHVANFISSKPRGTFYAFLTVHSYGQLLMAPYGYTPEPTPDYPELERAARVATTALHAVYGTTYRVGRSSTILYPSSGTSRDWAKGVAGIRYVYTMELRDNGTHGFLLPPDQILATGQETWAGIKAMALDIADRNGGSNGASDKTASAKAWLLAFLFSVASCLLYFMCG